MIALFAHSCESYCLAVFLCCRTVVLPIGQLMCRRSRRNINLSQRDTVVVPLAQYHCTAGAIKLLSAGKNKTLHKVQNKNKK